MKRESQEGIKEEGKKRGMSLELRGEVEEEKEKSTGEENNIKDEYRGKEI